MLSPAGLLLSGVDRINEQPFPSRHTIKQNNIRKIENLHHELRCNGDSHAWRTMNIHYKHTQDIYQISIRFVSITIPINLRKFNSEFQWSNESDSHR